MGDNELVVTGRQVDYIFFPGEPPVVSHAEYHFENRTPAAKTCAVTSCHFIENETSTRLDGFYVYAEDQLLERGITIAPGSELDVTVTFAFRQVSIGVNFRYALQLNVECGATQYEVVSKLNIIREQSAKE